jgi:hypothetical protein
MKNTSENAFWSEFASEASALAQMMIVNNLREVFQRIEAMLYKYGFEYCFELTEDEHDAVLVLTPEGDHEQARAIDKLIEAKPDIPGWRIYGRRQQKPLADVFTFIAHIYGLNVRDATFDILKTAHGREVTMWSDAIKSLSDEEARGLVATFLEHAIGEDIVMSNVGRIDGRFGRKGALSSTALVEQFKE